MAKTRANAPSKTAHDEHVKTWRVHRSQTMTYALFRAIWQNTPCDAHVKAWMLYSAPGSLSLHEKRVLDLLSDGPTLRHLGEVADPQHIDALARFVEEVATLPDQQPPGSYLRRTADEPLMFATRADIKRDLGKAHTTANALIEVIKRTAPTLQERFGLNDACQLIELLERFSAEAIRISGSFADRAQIDKRAKDRRRKSGDFDTPTEGAPASPGGTAGNNSGRNCLIQKIGQLAVIHLGGRCEDLVSEVARVLRGDEQSTHDRTARDILPNVALTPAKDEWRLGDDWRNLRKQLDQ